MEFQWLTGFSAGDGLYIFRRLNQCESAGDGLALNRLALARNGCGLQDYCIVTLVLFCGINISQDRVVTYLKCEEHFKMIIACAQLLSMMFADLEKQFIEIRKLSAANRELSCYTKCFSGQFLYSFI